MYLHLKLLRISQGQISKIFQVYTPVITRPILICLEKCLTFEPFCICINHYCALPSMSNIEPKFSKKNNNKNNKNFQKTNCVQYINSTTTYQVHESPEKREFDQLPKLVIIIETVAAAEGGDKPQIDYLPPLVLHPTRQSWPNGQLLLVVVAGRRRRSEPYHMCVMHE